MNVVTLAGRLADRPFRPGNGDRVVVKLDVDGENPSKSDRIELHCFGAVGERAMRLWQGDLVGIRGRIELRIWTEDGEEYDELRVVCHRIDVLAKGNTQRTPREGGWNREGGGRDGANKREGGWDRDRNDRGNERSGEWITPKDSANTNSADPVDDHNDRNDADDL
jgi:single-stranded DNA-binding protein